MTSSDTDRLQEVFRLAFEGLTTDGAHHKQWYLEYILEQTLSIPLEVFRERIEKTGYAWEEGIAP